MVVVDTSVALKWFLPEEHSQAAKDLLREEAIGCPDLLLYEFVNVLGLQRVLSAQDIQKFLDLLYETGIQFFVLPKRGFQQTMILCRKFGLTGYDASFLALAQALKADFVTADKALARKVRSLPFVHLLG